MLCLCATQLKFWFQTDLEREVIQLLQAGKTVAFDFSHPWWRVGHALRPIFMPWLVKIWQVSSCVKFRQHLESCLLWQLKLTEFCLNLWCFLLSFSTGCTKWNSAAIRSLQLFMASLFIGVLFEKYVACRSRRSNFGWHRFRFFSLLDA